jgi:toxin ParE1/3/4
MANRYKLRQSAREDIKKIGRYTLQKYGEAKRNEYLLGLESQFESIAAMPLRSRQRNDIKEGYYSAGYKSMLFFSAFILNI